MKRANIHINRIPEGPRNAKGAERIFREMRTENSPNLEIQLPR